MKATNYRLDFAGGILAHQLQRTLVLRDEERLMGYERRSRKVNRSEYFATLASWIDEVCLRLDHKNVREIAKLQRVVDDLLYLYTNYEIKKKRQFRGQNSIKRPKS